MTTGKTAEIMAAIEPKLRGEVRRAAGLDGAPLAYRYWAATEPRDAAVYLHGIAGHSLWFSAAATHLAKSGVTVYGHDRRGSGLNTQLGPGHASHHRVVLDDIRTFVDLARAEHPGGKVFLIAGCWGAKPGVVFAQWEQARLDGLVLVAPALSVRVKLPLKDLLGVAYSLVTNPLRRFPIPLVPEQYTDNPKFRTFVAADRDRLLEVTARFYLETARLDRLAARSPGSIRLPVLLVQGGRDAIVDVDGVRRWFGRLASPDKTLKIYPESAHILEFEGHQETYLADLLAWVDAHGSAHAKPAIAPPRLA
jgi:acylglycerol lipase